MIQKIQWSDISRTCALKASPHRKCHFNCARLCAVFRINLTLLVRYEPWELEHSLTCFVFNTHHFFGFSASFSSKCLLNAILHQAGQTASTACRTKCWDRRLYSAALFLQWGWWYSMRHCWQLQVSKGHFVLVQVSNKSSLNSDVLWFLVWTRHQTWMPFWRLGCVIHKNATKISQKYTEDGKPKTVIRLHKRQTTCTWRRENLAKLNKYEMFFQNKCCSGTRSYGKEHSHPFRLWFTIYCVRKMNVSPKLFWAKVFIHFFKKSQTVLAIIKNLICSRNVSLQVGTVYSETSCAPEGG